MLLTIFYIAATWMQSRRLSTLRRKIVQFANGQKSVVFFKVPDGANDPEEGFPVTGISSQFCVNKDKAMVEEVLHYASNSRSCALFPQQIVNVDNWITFTEESTFPIKLSTRKATLKDPRLFLLIETSCLDNMNCSDAHSCNINQIGVPRAWRADNTLGVIIESDIDHLTKISSLFLSFPVFIDSGFEICRIQSVGVEGKPCLVLNSDKTDLPKSFSVESELISSLKSINANSHPSKFCSGSMLLHKAIECLTFPASPKCCQHYASPTTEWQRQLSFYSSPTQWKSHMELLKNFSECAAKATQGQSMTVPGDQSTSIAPGDKVLILDPPVEEILSKNEIKEELIKVERKLVSESLPVKMKAKSISTVMLPGESARTSSESSTVVSAQSTPSKYDSHARKNTFSSLYSLGSASTLSVRSFGSGQPKPPNILIYSESPTTTDNIKSVLNETIHKHKYTIYSITVNQLATTVWAANCFLLVLCGNVPREIEPILISYLIQGGKLLCLCSSFLHSLLPTFRTAEVRERELVHFTYGKWRRVRLMHHVFCYQNSPSKSKFSGDSDEAPNDKDRVSPVPQTPSSVEVFDNNGVSHTLHVQVLGVEETWQTPSLLLAYFTSPGGRAVFSQVHLELDPSESNEEEEGEALRHSEISRKEIIKDILSSHLGLEIGGVGGPSTYTVAYFLGRHEAKLNFLDKTKHLLQDGVLKVGSIGVKFCGKGETPPPATASLLPVLVHSCPRDFSTLDYFDNLGTKALGRLLIYSEVLGSSMDVVNGELAHGLAVVPSQQTAGKGRSSNQWLSPPGCAMFSLQIHFSSNSYMGTHPSILQHVVSVSIASSLSEMNSEYRKALDIHLKWPNDLYTNGSVKIGGLIATCIATKNTVICNVGCGINLDNEVPTTCINKLIEEYNKANNQKLKKITREKLFARIFTQLEKILDRIQEGDIQYVEDLYYQYWLHGGAQVTVLDSSGSVRHVTVRGIDEFGFLEVQEASGNVFTVHPDGNSFDMMEGLIAPKLN